MGHGCHGPGLGQSGQAGVRLGVTGLDSAGLGFAGLGWGDRRTAAMARRLGALPTVVGTVRARTGWAALGRGC